MHWGTAHHQCVRVYSSLPALTIFGQSRKPNGSHSYVPKVHGGFRSFNIRHVAQVTQPGLISPRLLPQKRPARGAALFIQTHLQAFSAAFVIVLMAFFIVSMVIPSLVMALEKGHAANPQQSTSMESQQGHHPCLLHYSTSS